MDSKESLVQLASKKDLMAILLFLEERLPHTYDVCWPESIHLPINFLIR